MCWRHTERKETKGTRETHASADGLSPITDMYTERKETKGMRGLPERRAFFFAAQHSKLHRSPSLDQQWLLAGSCQFARVVKGVDLRSTARKCAWVLNPIADMSGWSHSGRRRKLALSPGVAFKTHASADGLSPMTCVGGTRKGRKRKERVRPTQVRMVSAPSLICTWEKEGNERNAWSA